MADRLDDSEWVHHLPNIPIGGRKRLQHDCGEGRPLVVFRKEPESSAYCHRCGKVGYHERVMSLAERIAAQEKAKAADNAARASLDLPANTSSDPSDWPADLRNWFYRCGLGPAHLSALGAYYNEELGRCVLPIKDGTGKVVYWSARHASRSPKWLGPDVSKHGLVVKHGVGRGKVIVLCEDLLSAYKVGLVCEAWALMGTKIRDRTVTALLNDPRPVVTWLDDDQGRHLGKNPGQEAAAAIRRRLRALGKEVVNVKSAKDPKYLPRHEIGRMLDEE